MEKPGFVPLSGYRAYSPDEMTRRAARFCAEMSRRRTVRDLSDRPVPQQVIADCIRTAGSAPSGANAQPWYFVAISDPAIKARIREAAEVEERAFYEARAPQDWLDALAPLGTTAHKPFLETAPYLIAIFARRYRHSADGQRVKHYYVQESVGIATGLLIAAIHHAGLVTLTHTPSPMNFLNEILGRPDSERPFLLLIVGYPQEQARVPDIRRKSLGEIAEFL